MDETVPQTEVPPEKVIPGRFKKGESGNPGGQFKHGGKVPLCLKDMRHAYTKSKARDRTNGQKLCRKLMEENPEKFLDRMLRYEEAHRARADKGSAREQKTGDRQGKEAPLPADEGEKRVLELIDRLLEELGNEPGGRDGSAQVGG